jgi:hypothetical protein
LKNSSNTESPVEELTAPLTAEVDVFTMRSVTRAPRAFQNHNEVKLTGEYRKESKTFPAGTIIVRTAQPLGILACYLLEAESDDGLVDWNFFDAYLEAGKHFSGLQTNAECKRGEPVDRKPVIIHRLRRLVLSFPSA